MQQPMFKLEAAGRTYDNITALRPTSLTIMPGETVALVGPSGAGKTTLLHMLAGIVLPSTGRCLIDGQPTSKLRPGRELARQVGIIHQQFDLVLPLPVVHNVLAGRLGEWGLLKSALSLIFPQEVDKARAALERVGIADKIFERTSRLSGGQQQRVALARILLQNPRAILADEPVSSLDPAWASDLMRLLTGIAAADGKTLVASLHSVDLARQHFSRIIGLRAGRVWFDLPAGEVTDDDLARLYSLETGVASA